MRAARLPFLSTRREVAFWRGAAILFFEFLQRTSGAGIVAALAAEVLVDAVGAEVPDLPAGRGFEDTAWEDGVSSSETGSCFTLTGAESAKGCRIGP